MRVRGRRHIGHTRARGRVRAGDVARVGAATRPAEPIVAAVPLSVS
jgi:hypothetical protein